MVTRRWASAAAQAGALLAAALLPIVIQSPYRYVALLLVGALALVALLSLNTAGLAVLCLPGVLLVTRAGGGAISLADLLVAGAAAIALVAGVPRSLDPQSRLLLRGLAVYLALLLPSILSNHDLRGDLEWLHRAVIVGGAVLSGYMVVQRGLLRLALRLLLGGLVLLAVAAVFTSVTTGFAPAYPAGFWHKNFAGSVLAGGVLLSVIAPESAGLRRSPRLVVVVTLGLGLLATQSRGGMLAVVVGYVAWTFASAPEVRRRRVLTALPLAAGLSFFIVTSVDQQFEEQAAGRTHDSLTQRFEVEAQTRELWEAEPVVGVGLRYWKTDDFTGYQAPNNTLNNELAEAGFVGLLGFLVLQGVSALALWRAGGPLATAALAVLVGRLAHGLVDIYWIGAQTALVYLNAGAGLAAARLGPAAVTRDTDLFRSPPAARSAAQPRRPS